MVRPPAPAVSVVIPAYNPGALILQSVASALDQTLDGVEVVVVDDGSTDGMEEQLRGSKDRIRYVRFDENRGVAAARNEGIRVSSGRYIAFLDADDLFMPERMERLVDFMEANLHLGFATSDAYYMFGDEPSTSSYFSVPELEFHEDDQDVHIMESNFCSNILIIRRELFDRHGYYDESLRSAEDWDRCIAFILGGERCGFLPVPLAYNRVRQDSLGSDTPLMLRNRVAVLERWLRQDLRKPVHQAAERTLAQARWETGRMMRAGRQPGAAALLLKVAARGPVHLRIRALGWLLLPRVLTERLRERKLSFLLRHGGHWALHRAGPLLMAGKIREAHPYVLASALFGYPLRVRMRALGWLLLPPARGALGRALLSDPILKDGRARLG